MAMTVSEPVLDENGLCCLDVDGRGLCNPITCSCGPDLHLMTPVDHTGPDGAPGDPDDSGTDPNIEIRERLDAVACLVREMRGLAPDAPVPDVLAWTPAEIAAAVPLMYPTPLDEPEDGEGSS